MTEEQIKFPIGKFNPPESYTQQAINEWIARIKGFSQNLREALDGLSDDQLNTPYRPGGWTLKQIVHHITDSYMNFVIRFKLALTEENPLVKSWNEAKWADLPDYTLPLDASFTILEGLGLHWAKIVSDFTDTDWNKTFVHSGTGETVPLKKALAQFSWHTEHHLVHIIKAEETKKFK